MKKILLVIPLLLSACAMQSEGTMHDYATQQNIKIDNKNIQITGDLLTPYKQNNLSGSRTWQRHLIISFNGNPVIDGYLSNPREIQGELSGEYDGKPVATICTSSRETQQTFKVDCMILVNNERTVTLTF